MIAHRKSMFSANPLPFLDTIVRARFEGGGELAKGGEERRYRGKLPRTLWKLLMEIMHFCLGIQRGGEDFYHSETRDILSGFLLGYRVSANFRNSHSCYGGK